LVLAAEEAVVGFVWVEAEAEAEAEEEEDIPGNKDEAAEGVAGLAFVANLDAPADAGTEEE
jgi:hypothetical protein